MFLRWRTVRLKDQNATIHSELRKGKKTVYKISKVLPKKKAPVRANE
jgi:hypothetical protein